MYHIKTVADKIGISIQALYYYEKEGLLPEIKRDNNNRRLYTDIDIEWILMIHLMREIDTPISIIKTYIDLLKQGSSTVEERLNFVTSYKHIISEKINKLIKAKQKVENKEKFYENAISSNVKFDTFEEELQEVKRWNKIHQKASI